MNEVKDCVNKSDVIKTFAKKAQLSEQDAAFLTDTVLSEIIRLLVEEKKEVVFRGFGRFSTVIKRAYKARNPRNGDTLTTREKQKIRFKSSKKLLELINEKLEN